MKDNIFFSGEDVGMNIIPVMNIDPGYKLQDDQLPEVLPILPLRNAVLFPDTVIPIPVSYTFNGRKGFSACSVIK